MAVNKCGWVTCASITAQLQPVQLQMVRGRLRMDALSWVLSSSWGRSGRSGQQAAAIWSIHNNWADVSAPEVGSAPIK